MKIIGGRRLSFTLLELLVVISIIALLMSILLPVLSSARAVANQTQCLANQHALGFATQNYATDNDRFVPPCYVLNASAWYGTNDVGPSGGIMNGFHYRLGSTTPNPIQGWTGSFTWAYWIYPYAPNGQLFIDPAHATWPDPWDYKLLSGQPPLPGTDSYYYPVGSIDGQFWCMNYGANLSVLGFVSSTGSTNNINDARNYLNLDLQPTPADTFMYMDAGEYVSFHEDVFDNQSTHYVPGMDMQEVASGGVTTFVANAPWIPFGFVGPDATYMKSDHDLSRHPGNAINAVMVDGHTVTEQKSFVLSAAESIYGGNNPVTSNTVEWWYYLGGYTP